MKISKKWMGLPLVLGVGYLAVNPAPVYGIFGFGDVVFDPTSYATLGHIWSEDISNGAKLMQTYNQTVKIVQNGLQMYNLAMAMSQRVQNKSVWETAAFAVGNETTQQHYNETVNFSAVMNGDYLHAGTAWQQSTRNAGTGGYLGSSAAQNSTRMSEYATIQLLDQTSQRCASLVGQYKQMQANNQAAEDKLTSDAYDQTDAKNAMVAVLNVLSGGQLHVRNQSQINGNLQACLAEQSTLQAKVQRDRLADEQQWYSDISSARANTRAMLDPNATAAVQGNYLVP